MSLGGSSSKSTSSSDSNRFGYQQSSQVLDATQAANQNALYGQYQNQLGGVQQNNLQQAGMRNQQGLTQLGQGNTMGQQQALAQAQQSQGMGQQLMAQGQQGLQGLNQFASQANPFAQQQISQLGQNLGDMFRQQIMPGIGGDFQNAGQRGSSRQGIAEGLAAQGISQQFQQGSTALQNNAYNQAVNSAGQVAQLGINGAGQQAQIAQGAQGQLMTSQLGGAQAGANASVALQGAQFQPFAIGASLANPSTLTNSFGLDTAQSRSRGKSSGASMQIGFGG